VDAGAWATSTFNTPTFVWGGVYAFGTLDPSDWTITPGGFDSDGTHLALCRAMDAKGIQVGKARAFGGTMGCDFGYGGGEVWVTQFIEVRFVNSTQPGTWTGAGSVDWSTALVAGLDNDDSELGACRVYVGGTSTSGKIIHPGGTQAVCNYGWGGKEQSMPWPDFEVYSPPPLPSEPRSF
jgi:hypothetical protein